MAITIKKQPDGTYSVRAWSKMLDAFGKRKNKYKSGIKSVSSAQKWGELAEALLSEDKFQEDIKFKKLDELYMEARKDKMTPTTIYSLQFVIQRVVNYFGDVKAKDINTRMVQQYVDKLSKEKAKNKKTLIKSGTIRKDYRHIQAVLNWGVAQDYLEFNRVKRIEVPEDEDPFVPTILPAEKIGEILSFFKNRYYNLYIPTLISVTMSPRRGEFLGLKWDAIDFDRGTIDIKKNRTMAGYKIIETTKLKTKGSKRLLVMSDFVKNELLAHKNMCRCLNSEYVCANVFTGETPTNPSYITKTFIKVMKDEFNIKMRIHDLRHCFNQIAYEDNIDDTTRIKIMGHSNFETNRNIYTQASLKKNKEAMNTVSSGIEKSFKENKKIVNKIVNSN